MSAISSGACKSALTQRIITLLLLMASSATPAMAHHRHQWKSYGTHHNRLDQRRSFRPSDQRGIRTYRRPFETEVVTSYRRPGERRVVRTYEQPFEREVVTSYRRPGERRVIRTYKQPFEREIVTDDRTPIRRRQWSEPDRPPISRVDTNSCVEGSVLGGLIGAGLGAVLSRGEGRWVGVPLGGAAGALVGCQVDGG